MLIGIDGGGTKTTFVLSDEALNKIKRVDLGSTSIRTVPFEKSMETLETGINALIKEFSSPITALFAGIGDVSDNEDAELIKNRLKTIKGLDKAMIGVGNDIECAHAGALDNGHGITVIIGTGTVVYASSRNHGECRVGGYSYKEGDPGSAYAIGRKALDLIGRVYDGRLDDSLLVMDLRKHLDIHTFKDIVLMHEAMHEDRTKTAELAKFVTKHAKKNDHHALRILEEGSDEIVKMIEAAMRRVSLTDKRIAIIGGLGTADTPYKDMIERKIKALDKHLEIIEPIHEAVIGSLYLARNMID